MAKAFPSLFPLSALSALIIALILRASLLGYSDLIDPTETRYASVAQQMVLDNDWVTPKLPQPEGVVPYMGKPPLHFWMTAGVYKVFGFSNWGSRFPSLISTIIILLLTIFCGRRFFGKEAGELAALISFSSALNFILAGASVVDVTLSAGVCSAIVCFACYFEKPTARLARLLGVILALGFLIKGPVAIALFAFAVFPFLIFQRKLKQIFTYHWISLLLPFLLISTPWFVFSEIATPGFTKYFFWNENLARYLVKDYGDLYGTGHVYPRGTSWIMLLLAFMPWTVPFILGLFSRNSRGCLWQNIKDDKWLMYTLCWGLSPAIFFSFGRQLHVSYLIPGVPGLSLFFARWINLYWDEKQKDRFASILSLCSFISFAGLLVGTKIEGTSWRIIVPVLLSGSLLFLIAFKSGFSWKKPALPAAILQLCLLLFFAIILATPILNLRKSTNSILQQMLASSSGEDLRVGVVTENNYSPYWLSKKWNLEGRQKIKVEYVSNSPVQTDPPKDLLLKEGSESNLAEEIFSRYELKLKVGKWSWYRIKGPL